MWKELEKAVDLGLVRALGKLIEKMWYVFVVSTSFLPLARHIGVSNFDISQVDRILHNCRIRPFNNQVEIHPFLERVENWI